MADSGSTWLRQRARRLTGLPLRSPRPRSQRSQSVSRSGRAFRRNGRQPQRIVFTMRCRDVDDVDPGVGHELFVGVVDSSMPCRRAKREPRSRERDATAVTRWSVLARTVAVK